MAHFEASTWTCFLQKAKASWSCARAPDITRRSSRLRQIHLPEAKPLPGTEASRARSIPLLAGHGPRQTAQKTDPVWNRSPEIFRDSLSQVGQRQTSSQIHTVPHARAVRKYRNILTRMVGGWINRVGIAAMIGGDY